MKTIRIKFVDMYGSFNPKDNVIFNTLAKRYNVVFSEQPEYLFFGCFGYENLKYNCIKIFYCGEDLTPDFNTCDYAMAFDRLSFHDRYLRFPCFLYGENLKTASTKHRISDEEIAEKTNFCNFIVSNGGFGDPKRTEFFHKLSEYKKVDSGGKYLNNIGYYVGDKIEFQRKYKFSIAFENGNSVDYTTEKIVDAFAAKTIPIYWGNPDIAKDFNEKSFINCHNYNNFDEVIERINEIDNDPELYRSILEQPIFSDEKIPFEFSRECLENFLYNIFDQPIEKARRLNPNNCREIFVLYDKRLFAKYGVRLKKFLASTPIRFLYNVKKKIGQ